MEKVQTNMIVEDNAEKILQNSKLKRKFFDIVFFIGFLSCLIPGAFPGLAGIASIILLLCIAISFFDENFYIYTALLVYMRYKMVIGGSTAFRLYSYLVVLRFLIDLPKLKFRIAYLPALFVFFMYCLFAITPYDSLRGAGYIMVDCVLVYIILLKVLSDTDLMRKFMFAFLLGGVASAVYGWTNADVSVDINIRGAGAHTVNRNFGALGDSNFAGLFYSLCIIGSVVIKKIPLWLRAVLVSIFVTVLLQTASLSAILVLCLTAAFLIILKFRGKSVIILSCLAFAAIVGVTIMLSIPQFREIEAIAGLLIRIEEKLSYLARGRWDLLTTDRSAIWSVAMRVFSEKSIWGKLVGGTINTVFYIDESVMNIACHNSYLQSVLDFGILGTIFVYGPLFAVFIYRLCRHLSLKPGYEGEDMKMMQLLFSFGFIVFGFTVDFFIDWAYMMFYFI